MKLYRWLAFFMFFFISCSDERKSSWTIRNNTSSVLTMIYADETSVRLLADFCFKLATEDFPLIIMFEGEDQSLSLNEPNHYLIESSKKAQKASTPCQPIQIYNLSWLQSKSEKKKTDSANLHS